MQRLLETLLLFIYLEIIFVDVVEEAMVVYSRQPLALGMQGGGLQLRESFVTKFNFRDLYFYFLKAPISFQMQKLEHFISL